MGVGAVLSQDGHPIAVHNEKLSMGRRNWSTYEQELFAFCRACKVWEPYLLNKEFVVSTDHMALKQINGDSYTNKMHARWLSYLQRFDFSMKHRSGKSNKVADVLSRRRSVPTLVRELM